MSRPLPDDQVLPGMPPPPPPPAPAPVMVSGAIKVRLHFEADVAALVKRFPREFESAAEREGGYQPWEQGSVFLWDVIFEQLEVYLAHIPGALSDLTGGPDVDIEFSWTKELNTRLTESLGIEVE